MFHTHVALGQLFLATACLFVTGLCLARTTQLIFFNRLMVGKQYLRYALYASTTLMFTGSITVVNCFIFACRPIAKSWDVSMSGTCISRPAIFIAVAVLNICSDLCLIILPLPLIYELQLPRSQKLKFMAISMMVCMWVYPN